MKAKKINKLNVLIIIVTIATIFFACKKTTDTIVSQPPPVDTTVTASVAGHVTDINNAPVSNALVTAGTTTTTTDVNGQFSIKNATLSADAGLVIITKPGYFEGSRTFLVDANTVNNIIIQLIPKAVSGTFDAASGGIINVSGGGSVSFGGSNVVSASNGAAYSGNVAVSSFYLNPGDANFGKYMPGDLHGLNASGQQTILQSFGMVLVELNDANGGRLQIATGKTATITIPIPSAMQANAPASIPLWYFNDTSGIWKQQGSASKQGNNYVGTVAHFSFWTAGQLGQSVKLNAKFVFDTSSSIVPIDNKLVTITSSNYGTTNTYTDSTGTVSGLVPANETLSMKVFNACGDSIYEKNIGPFTTDTNLGTITVTGITCYTPPAEVTLSATLKDQNGNALSGNLVLITNATFDDSNISINSSGQFSTTVPSGQSFVMKVFDQLCGGIIYTQNIGPFISITDLGTITVAVTPHVSGTISGTVVDCNNNPVTNGSVYANIDNNLFSSSITNGNFAITFSRCSNSPVSATISVSDVATGQLIAESPTTVSSGNQNIGQIIIPCSSVIPPPDSSFINVSLGGETNSWTSSDSLEFARIDSGGSYNTSIWGASSKFYPTKFIWLRINNDNASPGTYNLTFSATINDSNYVSTGTGLTTTVTAYGPVGEYISGTASGQVLLQAGSTFVPFTCSYMIKRTQ